MEQKWVSASKSMSCPTDTRVCMMNANSHQGDAIHAIAMTMVAATRIQMHAQKRDVLVLSAQSLC